MQNEVVTLNDKHQVRFEGKLTAKQFDSKGSALAYLLLLASGKQKPDFIIGQK